MSIPQNWTCAYPQRSVWKCHQYLSLSIYPHICLISRTDPTNKQLSHKEDFQVELIFPIIIIIIIVNTNYNADNQVRHYAGNVIYNIIVIIIVIIIIIIVISDISSSFQINKEFHSHQQRREYMPWSTFYDQTSSFPASLCCSQTQCWGYKSFTRIVCRFAE